MRRPFIRQRPDAPEDDGTFGLRDTYRILDQATADNKRIRASCASQREMIASQREYLKELSAALSLNDGDADEAL